MKKLCFLIAALTTVMAAQAQYQIQNGGFEQWEREGEASVEPMNWNSFMTASGALVSMAGTQVEKTTDAHSGSAAVRIFGRSVFGVVAQGNLTTGRINMGSTNATDASGNYNYTDMSDGAFNQPFTGLPDALRFWVKSSCAFGGGSSCYLHTAGYYQEPAANDITATRIAKAENTAIPNSDSWQEVIVPFTYDVTDGTRPAYALLSLMTSGQPGKGNKNDWMIIDDVEFLYYSELETAIWNGSAVNFTNNAATIDGQYDESLLRLRIKGQGAKVIRTYDEGSLTLTILIEGDDISVNPDNTHTYTITFTGNENPDGPVGPIIDPDEPTTGSALIPNGSFEQWKDACGKTIFVGGNEQQRPGTEPEGWSGSSITYRVLLSTKRETLVEEVDGMSGKGVKLTNKSTNPTIYVWDTYVHPAYITLGTPWFYHTPTALGDLDGGTYGGQSFNRRPDAIRGNFRRSDPNGNELAHIIAYLWKGTFKSKIGKKGAPGTEAENVDRAIMGKDSNVSGDGQLIASCDYTFASTTNGNWQTITVPLDYVSGEGSDLPEKMNIIISSADYWNHNNMKVNNTLEVDDLEFVYYSELSEATYDGSPIDFSNGEARIMAEYDPSLLTLKADGRGASIHTEFNEAQKLLTIIVSGSDVAENPTNQHTYTVLFGPQVVRSVEYTDLIKVTINDYSSTPKRTTITLEEMDNGVTNFILRNFTMGEVDNPTYVGTIKLEDLHFNDDKTFHEERSIVIQNGDMPAGASWMGPSLGEVPISMDGVIRNDSLLVKITIDMMAKLNQNIVVVFGESLINELERQENPDEPEPEGGKTIHLEGTHTYTDNLVVSLNGEANPPMETSIKVVFHDNGTLDLSLENFMMEEDGEVMGVGNIVLQSVPFVTRAGKADATFRTTENVNITAGSDPSVMWMGPMLGSIPVSLSGKVGEDKLYCVIDINMAGIGVIHVTFGADQGWPEIGGEPEVDPILQDRIYTSLLSVTVNGETSHPEEAVVTMTVNDDGTVNLSLNDFWLATEDGMKTPIGTIELKNILPVAVADKDYYMFMTSNSITIQPGSDTSLEWVGPYLGEIPVSMSGKIALSSFFTSISIYMASMNENVMVTFGADFTDAINDVVERRASQPGIYSLAGQRLSKVTRGGIYIINNRKVVIK